MYELMRFFTHPICHIYTEVKLHFLFSRSATLENAAKFTKLSARTYGEQVSEHGCFVIFL